MTCPVDYTCPIIDAVIEFIQNTNHDDADAMVDEMETIRSMNSEIRAWGDHQEDIAEEREAELEDAQDDINSLRSTVDELTEEVRDKDELISVLEDRIEELSEMLREVA